MQILDRHTEIKKQLIGHMQRLAAMAEQSGMRTLAGDIRTTRIPKLEQERFHLVVLGEFNHGKSTFVNALLGAEILPAGITPTTATINHVVWSPSPRAEVVLRDGQKVPLGPERLEEWVTVTAGRASQVAYVEVGYPCDLLKGGITLVDTPGVNDLNEQRAEVTYGYVPRADAVIFLLDAGQALKDSEREFLASHVLEGSRDRLIFVLGKMDLLSPVERSAVLDYVRRNLNPLVPEPVLLPISAREWLAGRKVDSGVPELLGHLRRFLDTDRARILLDNGTADAMRTAAYLEQNLAVKQRAYDLDLTDLEQRVAALREQLDAGKRKLDELHGRIQTESAAIKSQLQLDLELFTERFVQVLPAQIDAVDAEDVKLYLGGFIEEKFREWAELEGHKVVSLLERLAEDVITVTNQNLSAVSSTLASRFPPGETEVPIDVDSFKYDVGVYAVGALGTTVFLFVNTLAGGLLTLVAPILAIVVKSKVAGDIREQAKKRVPAVIQHAAEAMRPHFDQCIDDFARRLREFVAAAGNTLYRGISEVLDQAINDRRQRSGELAQLRRAIEESAGQVRGAQEELQALRARLWNPPPGPAS
jgi:ribosome biogenesis GTPase A